MDTISIGSPSKGKKKRQPLSIFRFSPRCSLTMPAQPKAMMVPPFLRVINGLEGERPLSFMFPAVSVVEDYFCPPISSSSSISHA
jgi:hypothetical protein